MTKIEKIQLACLQGMLANPVLVRWANAETQPESRITLDSHDQREALIFKAYQIAEQWVNPTPPSDIKSAQHPTPNPT